MFYHRQIHKIFKWLNFIFVYKENFLVWSWKYVFLFFKNVKILENAVDI